MSESRSSSYNDLASFSDPSSRIDRSTVSSLDLETSGDGNSITVKWTKISYARRSSS